MVVDKLQKSESLVWGGSSCFIVSSRNFVSTRHVEIDVPVTENDENMMMTRLTISQCCAAAVLQELHHTANVPQPCYAWNPCLHAESYYNNRRVCSSSSNSNSIRTTVQEEDKPEVGFSLEATAAAVVCLLF